MGICMMFFLLRIRQNFTAMQRHAAPSRQAMARTCKMYNSTPDRTLPVVDDRKLHTIVRFSSLHRGRVSLLAGVFLQMADDTVHGKMQCEMMPPHDRAQHDMTRH